MIRIECPSCKTHIRLTDAQLQNEDVICTCGYLIFLSEIGINPLRIVEDDPDLRKCS